MYCEELQFSSLTALTSSIRYTIAYNTYLEKALLLVKTSIISSSWAQRFFLSKCFIIFFGKKECSMRRHFYSSQKSVKTHFSVVPCFITMSREFNCLTIPTNDMIFLEYL
jgi:hypothetical protein